MSSPRELTRRVFLQRAFAFSAAASLAGCAQGITSATGGSQAPASPTTPAPKETVHLFMVGDWGTGDSNESAVATAMQTYQTQQGITASALLMLGDNFYGDMTGGVTSARWQSGFEQMFPQSAFNCPAYAVPGNHDYQNYPTSKVAAELAYAAQGNTRWTMPSTYYTFQFPATNPLVTFLALDSNAPNEPAQPPPPDSSFFTPTAANVATEAAWLATQLQQPLTTPFLIAMGHHPVYSNGQHGDNETLITNWDPLFRQYGVHLYLAGHDHDLQHLEFTGHPTSFVGSGGGGAPLYAEVAAEDSRGPFFDESHGFSHLEIQSSLLTFRHVDPNGNILHAFTKTPQGVVTILTLPQQ
ncbi:MAG TPA: metallophosphoesterase [Candidatus Aquilonibacter sp.]|nr:metallophosphoesterase [Candidatus Aquilonibacter sp.]